MIVHTEELALEPGNLAVTIVQPVDGALGVVISFVIEVEEIGQRILSRRLIGDAIGLVQESVELLEFLRG